MDIQKVIGKKIRQKMEENKISSRALAEFLGVTHPTISAYINGERVIDSEKLFRLSGYFKIPLEEFFIAGQPSSVLMFRADNPAENFGDVDRERIKKKLSQYRDIIDENQNIRYLPQQYGLAPEGNKLTKEENTALERIALEQRKIMGIENEIPPNYYDVFSRNNIHVLAFPLDECAVSGCSCIDPLLGSVIFVNTHKDLSEERQVFSLAHEYGHLLLHRNEYESLQSDLAYTSGRNNMAEKLVNKFAQLFLMPPPIMEACLKSDEFYRDGKIRIKSLKHYFKVSYVALMMALHDYGHITDIVYRQQWKLISQKKYNDIGGEPAPLERVDSLSKNPRLVECIKQLAVNDEISARMICEVLGIEIKEGWELIGKWKKAEDDQITLG